MEPKKNGNKRGLNYYFLECTLKDTLSTTKRAEFCPKHISDIYTPKQDHQHSGPFHIGVTPGSDIQLI